MTYPIKDENGSWYTLSNGDRVQGKAKAIAAEQALSGGSDSGGEYVVNDPNKTTTGKAAAPRV